MCRSFSYLPGESGLYFSFRNGRYNLNWIIRKGDNIIGSSFIAFDVNGKMGEHRGTSFEKLRVALEYYIDKLIHHHLFTERDLNDTLCEIFIILNSYYSLK